MSEALRMKDAGRSWKEIATRLGISIAEAKARVAEEKRERREALAHTPTNERARGLLDVCKDAGCGHLRKEHGEDGCAACRAKPDPDPYHDACESFRDEKPKWAGRSRYPNDLTREAVRLGVPSGRSRWLFASWGRPIPELPQEAKLATRVRRARRRAK